MESILDAARESTPSGNRTGQKIVPYLWFDNQALEAAQFYTSIFAGSRRTDSRFGEEGYRVHGQQNGSVMSVVFDLDGFELVAFNGGPQFSFTPAFSLFVTLESVAQVDRVVGQLLEGGQALMPLDSYPFSERYAWVADRYGLNWQVYAGSLEDVHGQRVIPGLMFPSGQAREAMERYASIFPNSHVEHISTFGDVGMGEEPAEAVAHAQFLLHGEPFIAQDDPTPGQWDFSEATSLLVECKDQAEIDYYWEELTRGSDPESQRCGWLKDEFGVSWQIVPEELGQMMSDPDPARVNRVVEAFMPMKKLEIAALREAYKM